MCVGAYAGRGGVAAADIVGVVRQRGGPTYGNDVSRQYQPRPCSGIERENMCVRVWGGWGGGGGVCVSDAAQHSQCSLHMFATSINSLSKRCDMLDGHAHESVDRAHESHPRQERVVGNHKQLQTNKQTGQQTTIKQMNEYTDHVMISASRRVCCWTEHSSSVPNSWYVIPASDCIRRRQECESD